MVIGQLLCLMKIMGRKENRLPPFPRELSYDALELLFRKRIETPGRLVRKQDRRAVQERAG